MPNTKWNISKTSLQSLKKGKESKMAFTRLFCKCRTSWILPLQEKWGALWCDPLHTHQHRISPCSHIIFQYCRCTTRSPTGAQLDWTHTCTKTRWRMPAVALGVVLQPSLFASAVSRELRTCFAPPHSHSRDTYLLNAHICLWNR